MTVAIPLGASSKVPVAIFPSATPFLLFLLSVPLKPVFEQLTGLAPRVSAAQQTADMTSRDLLENEALLDDEEDDESYDEAAVDAPKERVRVNGRFEDSSEEDEEDEDEEAERAVS